MRSYYTYGAIPDPVRTVQGFDDGGLASAPDYSTWKGDVQTGKSLMDFFKLGQERQFGPGALSSFTGPTSAAPVLPGNFSLYKPTERSAAEIAADYAKQSGLDLAGLAASQGKTEAQLMADINKAEVDPNTERGALNQIKDLAGNKDFQGAFEAAKAAEARMPGKDFVSTLVSPSSLRYLTPEMDKKDVNNYYDALKNVVGEKEYEKRYVSTGNEFSIDQAKEKNLSALEQGSNFVNPAAGEKAEETLLSKLPVKQLTALAAAAMGATAIPGLLGTSAGTGAGAAGTTGATAGTTAGAAAGTSGSGALSAIKSAYQAVTGIPGTIGKTVAQTLGLPINSAVAQTAFGNSLISGATTAAKGGDIGDIIKSGLLAAGVTYGVDAAANAVKGMMPQITKTVGQQVANTAATTGIPASTALDALQEVVVTGKRVADVAGLAGAATGALSGTRGVTQPSTEDLQEVEVTGKRVPTTFSVGALTGAVTTPTTPPKEPSGLTPEDLQEVEVTGKRVPTTPPIVVTPPTPPKVTPPTGGLEDLEEVEVKSKRPGPLTPPVIVTPPVTPPVKPPGNLTPEDLEEVEVKSKRPGPLTPPVVLTPPTPPKITPPKGPEDLEEVEVKSKKTPPVVTPPVVVTPPTGPAKPTEPTKPEDKKPPVDWPTILKLLGALGSAASTKTSGPTTTPTTGLPSTGFGGALPKYTYERTQLNPPIDYYTYGTRPEAKFFEGAFKLAEPTQPAMPPPSEPSGVVTSAAGGYIDENMTGGLIGYAHGGKAHTPEDYVEGPGSGREDLIPAMLSDGEYVIDAETLALLGDGSTKEGARRMDQFRANIRKHKGRALSRGRISPNAKSPDKYMGGGLT